MRTIYREDAIQWLESRNTLEGSSLVASLPDISEFPTFSLTQWKEWFVRVATLILSRCPDDGVTIFYQSDIKLEGVWVDKGYLVQKAAEATGHELLWHKIVCRAPAGTTTFGRPSYSHLICFSKGLKAELSKSTPDVLPELGDRTWPRGMGVEPAQVACRYILENTATRSVVNPFCGEGAVLAVANALGLEAIGIEKNAKRAERASSLQFSVQANRWLPEG